MTATFPIRLNRLLSVRIIGGLLVLLPICGFLVQSSWISPEIQLEQARKLSTNPVQALSLVRSSIRSAKLDFPEAQLFECQLLLDLKRGKEAERLFAKIRNPGNCDPENLCQLAEHAQAAGESALAFRVFLVAGDFVHHNPKHLKNLILVLYSRQDGDDREDLVLDLCREYAVLVPDDAFPWLVSSSLYHERGVPKLAIEAYQQALDRPLPTDEAFRVRFQLIQLAMLLGDLKLARTHFDALLAESNAQKPGEQKGVIALNADLLQREGKPADALVLLNKLLADNPGWTQALALRGKCRFDLKDFAGVIRDLSEVLSINDFDQQSHYLLGQAYLRQKDTVQATRHLNRSQDLNNVMAQIFTLENTLRNDLTNRELKLQLAELNDKRGDREKAAAWRRGAEKSVQHLMQK